jgi:RNA polymerase sigma factor (sigma-70 family)
MIDSELIDRCLGHECNAWAELRHLIERLARGLLAPKFNLDHSSIDDVIQITLVELLKNDLHVLRAFRRQCQLSTYLAVVMHRAANKHIESARKEISLEAIPDGQLPQPDSFSDSYMMSYNALFCHLPPVDRIILRLVSDGYRMQEIADMLTRSQGELFTATRVRKHKERAIKRLAQSLQQVPSF